MCTTWPRAASVSLRLLSSSASSAAVTAEAVGYRIAPLTSTCGAEIFGPDLGRPLTDAQTAAIRVALLEHGVVFFRDQKTLSVEAHVKLAKRFGEIDRHPIVRGMDAHPDVIEIVREAGARTNFGERHSFYFSFHLMTKYSTSLMIFNNDYYVEFAR